MDALQRKLFRMNNDLAPEDETIGQAQHTARQRNDPNYLERWIIAEEAMASPELRMA